MPGKNKVSDTVHEATTQQTLIDLAFENSGQANLILNTDGSKILTANIAACKLLGYSKRELLSKSRSDVFDINDSGFKNLLKQTDSKGAFAGLATVLKKKGERIPCQITSALFNTESGEQHVITTIADMSASILAQENIDRQKEKVITQNIAKAKLKQKAIDISSRKAVAHTISLAKGKQEQLDKKNERMVAENIIKAQSISDIKLQENNEWIKCIAKTSYDVMWDWNIVSGEIYVGDSIEEVFGYKVKNNIVNFEDFIQCLEQDEKNSILNRVTATLESDSKSWKDSYFFKRSNGSVAFTTSRASILRDDDGKAYRFIGATHDITRVQELENKLEEKIAKAEMQSEKGQVDATLSFGVMWDWKIPTNQILIGEGFEELFGYAMENRTGDTTSWTNHIHPDDREMVIKSFTDTLDSENTAWQFAYRFLRADNSMTKVFNRASIFRDSSGKAYRVMGLMQDISEQVTNSSNEQLMAHKKGSLVDKLKRGIVELIRHSDDKPQTKYSVFLSQKLQYDYTYLSNLFSEIEGIPIRQFIIEEKIKRAKELIIKGDITFTQIAEKLHYSSVAHLSNQFKKVTGLTPSNFKELHCKSDTLVQKG